MEHGDRSACVRTQVEQEGAEPTYLWQEFRSVDEQELRKQEGYTWRNWYIWRNGQMKQRVVEVGLTLDILHSINRGEVKETGAWTLSSSGGQAGYGS